MGAYIKGLWGAGIMALGGSCASPIPSRIARPARAWMLQSRRSCRNAFVMLNHPFPFT